MKGQGTSFMVKIIIGLIILIIAIVIALRYFGIGSEIIPKVYG